MSEIGEILILSTRQPWNSPQNQISIQHQLPQYLLRKKKRTLIVRSCVSVATSYNTMSSVGTKATMWLNPRLHVFACAESPRALVAMEERGEATGQTGGLPPAGTIQQAMATEGMMAAVSFFSFVKKIIYEGMKKD